MKNKINLIAWTIFLLFVLAFSISIYIDSQEVAPKKHQSKQIELNSNFITGYQDGKISWQVNANYIWTGRNRYLYKANKIESGLIMNKKGRVIIDHIQARNIKVNTRTKTFRTSGGLNAIFNREVEKENGEKSIKPISIKANELQYYQLSNRTVINNNIILKQDDVEIKPMGAVVVDHDEDLVKILDKVNIVSEQFEVTANSMILYLNDNYSEMKKGVKGKRFAKDVSEEGLDDRETELRAKESLFSCDTLTYKNEDKNDLIELIGNVKISQDDKNISGKYAKFDMKNEQYIIEGDVMLSATDIAWIIDKHKKTIFENETVQNALYKEVTIKAEKMVFESDSRYFKMFGDIEVIQDDLLIQSKKIEFNDETGILNLSGDIFITYNKTDNIEAKEIRVDINNETVETTMGIETEFELNIKE